MSLETDDFFYRMSSRATYRIISTALVITLAVFFFYKERGSAFAEPSVDLHLNEDGEAKARELEVRWVIDGDTIELIGGERIRYVGIDTPERDEPFYKEARTINAKLIAQGGLRFEPCATEHKDKYGRLLGWVYTGELDLGERLLGLGLAKTLTIPPCGLVKAKAYREAELEARASNLGLWGK